MKKIFTILILISSLNIFAQEETNEPDFIGEAIILNDDGSTLQLDKQTVQIKTRAGASVYLTGIGKVKQKIEIEGCCSTTNTNTSSNLKLIVKAVNNKTDPLSIVSVFKFNVKKKKRAAELASAGTFSGGSSNNLDYVKFKAKKYGESSYLLTIPSIESGEYGIIVSNPDALDERSTIVSSFSVN